MMKGFSRTLDEKFRIHERGSTIGNEIRAGTATFLTMAYILLVNPQVLGAPNTGISGVQVIAGTVIGSAVASFITGYFGNLPLGLAPGLGLSAYLSFGLVKGQHVPWEGALTCCFLSGMIVTILGIVQLADVAMCWIPEYVKSATIIGMGLLLTLIALQSIDLVVASGDSSLIMMGPLDRPELWISMGGLMLQASLAHHRFRGAVIIGIFGTTLLMWYQDNSWPSDFMSFPSIEGSTIAAALNLEFIFDNPREYLPGLIAFLVVGIFDVSGVVYGLMCLAGLSEKDEQNNVVVPGSKWAFIGSGVGTMIAACLGCSPIIVHIESAVGIKEGGRTGLTAVVVSCWFLVSLFFAPLFGSIPPEATAPVIVLIGASMMGQASEIDWKEMRIAIPAFLTLIVMPFTFSIPNGIACGMVSNGILLITTGRIFGYKDSLDEDDVEKSADTVVKKSSSTNSLNKGVNFSYGSVLLSEQALNSKDIPSPRYTHSPYRSPNLILRSEEFRHHYQQMPSASHFF